MDLDEIETVGRIVPLARESHLSAAKRDERRRSRVDAIGRGTDERSQVLDRPHASLRIGRESLASPSRAR